MSGINKVILVGNLGKDPEMNYLQDGTAVASFSVATSDEWKDKKTGKKKSFTEWHRIIAYRQLAEICAEYLSKGKLVYVEGKLRTRSYEDSKQITRQITEIQANLIQMLGARNGNKARSSAKSGAGNQRSNSQGRDDDIPF
ncbi:MAG: single-stranded DNA-binding protein [Desulfobacterales bacterium]|jgi:single-strand DNA-binding protein